MNRMKPIESSDLHQLLLKYHCPGGRYSSFPQVQFWNNNLDQKRWLHDIESHYEEDKGIDLYIHIPFCKSLCTFCGCNISITKNNDLQKDYIDQILMEFQIYKKTIGQKLKIASIYLGGGTPNHLEASNLDRLLDGIGHFDHNFTGTIEADPRYLTSHFLEVLKKYQFKNMSFGVQDFDQDVLHNLNRPQSFEQVKIATQLAREYGFTYIAYDLIYGLPMQTPESIEKTFSLLEQSPPDGLAFYPLAIVPWQAKSQNALSIWNNFSISKKYDLYLTGHEIALDLGFYHLGFGHYTKKTSSTFHAHKENQLKRSIMGFSSKKSKQLIGLGVSAISYSGVSYRQNNKVLAKYGLSVQENNYDQLIGHLQIRDEQTLLNFFETLICQSTLDLSLVKTLFSAQRYEQIIQATDCMKDDELLAGNGDIIAVTNLGKHFIKNICQVFDPHFS